MPTHQPPDPFGVTTMFFFAWCLVGLAAIAILITLFPTFGDINPPHRRQVFRRVGGTSFAATLLAALAWVLVLTEHFPTFDFPFESIRGTPLRRLLHTIAPSLAVFAFFFAFVQAHAFWRKRTTETICGHCGYPLSNGEHTNTTCAECGTTTAQLHPIPPGFRPTTRLSLANTLARFLLIAAAATLGWSLIYLPHSPTPPRISTHHIQCTAPDRPTANIHLTITEHRHRLSFPGASFVAYIDIRGELEREVDRHTRIVFIREPFAQIRAIIPEEKFTRASHRFSTGLRMPEYPRKQLMYSRIDTVGEGTYELMRGIMEGQAFFEPLSKISVHVSPQILRWIDPRRPCFRDELQSHIDQLIDRHTPRTLLPIASSSTATLFAELIAAATTATLAALLTLLTLTLARRRKPPTSPSAGPTPAPGP